VRQVSHPTIWLSRNGESAVSHAIGTASGRVFSGVKGFDSCSTSWGNGSG
jgi:hypothetical protein